VISRRIDKNEDTYFTQTQNVTPTPQEYQERLETLQKDKDALSALEKNKNNISPDEYKQQFQKLSFSIQAAENYTNKITEDYLKTEKGKNEYFNGAHGTSKAEVMYKNALLFDPSKFLSQEDVKKLNSALKNPQEIGLSFTGRGEIPKTMIVQQLIDKKIISPNASLYGFMNNIHKYVDSTKLTNSYGLEGGISSNPNIVDVSLYDAINELSGKTTKAIKETPEGFSKSIMPLSFQSTDKNSAAYKATEQLTNLVLNSKSVNIIDENSGKEVNLQTWLDLNYPVNSKGKRGYDDFKVHFTNDNSTGKASYELTLKKEGESDKVKIIRFTGSEGNVFSQNFAQNLYDENKQGTTKLNQANTDHAIKLYSDLMAYSGIHTKQNVEEILAFNSSEPNGKTKTTNEPVVLASGQKVIYSAKKVSPAITEYSVYNEYGAPITLRNPETGEMEVMKAESINDINYKLAKILLDANR
jgi:hypothetical protein